MHRTTQDPHRLRLSTLSRRQLLHSLVCGCGAMAVGACISDTSTPLKPGQRPTLDSLEGGLWDIMDRAEEEIRFSPLRMTDEGLNRYIDDIACKLAGKHCSNMRVYIMRTPYFNASMAPNGMMQVWSGLLLRCQNEAQLAAVLGHEIGHYIKRHTLQRFEQAQNASAVATFFGVLIAVAGGGALANLPQLMALSSIFAFSREQEREADGIGLELMADAGYAPAQASQLWKGLVEEREAGKTAEEVEEQKRNRDVFFATHPAPEERAQSLALQAAGFTGSASFVGRREYMAQARTFRDVMMEDELRLHQFSRTLAIIGRMAITDPLDPDVHYYRGEVYRSRNEGSDPDLAIASYSRALELADDHAGAWRGLGIVHRRAGRNGKSVDAFRRYLELAPDASDRLMIQSYLGA